jgi:hypothetical protein
MNLSICDMRLSAAPLGFCVPISFGLVVRYTVCTRLWAWDLVIIRLHCCGPPAPARRQFFALRFATVCH